MYKHGIKFPCLYLVVPLLVWLAVLVSISEMGPFTFEVFWVAVLGPTWFGM